MPFTNRAPFDRFAVLRLEVEEFTGEQGSRSFSLP
jgi:hypothetical protein